MYFGFLVTMAVGKGKRGKKHKHNAFGVNRNRKPKQPNEDDKNAICVKNVPTNVEFSSITSDVASFIARALSLSINLQVHDGKEYARFYSNDCGATTTMATLRLVPNASSKKTIVTCRGFGFLKISSNDNVTEESTTLLDPQRVVATLNSHASQNPFTPTGKADPIRPPLLFRRGSDGEEAEALLFEQGKPLRQAAKDVAVAKLRDLVEKNGGSMHIHDWRKPDRMIVNEINKRRKLGPREAAEAAGVSWNAATQMFTML